MHEQFQEFNFRQPTLELIEQANEIIDEYWQDGDRMTLRQLYYQFVSRDMLPENTIEQYNRIKNVVSKGRMAGLIDWDAIEDRTRRLESRGHWDSASEYIMADDYSIDLWADQEYRPEVWIEKNALIGVIEPICNTLDVPYFACIGYNSASSAYEAGKRFEGYSSEGLTPIVFHLGDHDPSGINMTDDNRSRSRMFAGDNSIEIRRLALNMDQVEEHNPPPNFAKETDSRFKRYVGSYGESCWELDALRPPVIRSLIEEAIISIRDEDEWIESIARQEHVRETLREVEGELAERGL